MLVGSNFITAATVTTITHLEIKFGICLYSFETAHGIFHPCARTEYTISGMKKRKAAQSISRLFQGTLCVFI